MSASGSSLKGRGGQSITVETTLSISRVWPLRGTSRLREEPLVLLHLVVVVPGVLVVHVHLGARQGHHRRWLDVLLQMWRDKPLRRPLGHPGGAAAGVVVHVGVVGRHVPLVGRRGGGGVVAVGEVVGAQRWRGVAAVPHGWGVLARRGGRLVARHADGAARPRGGGHARDGSAHHAVGTGAGLHQLLVL